MTFVKWGLVVICFFFFLNSISSADKSVYLYDDTGRLTRVLKGTEKVIYQYDEVGNPCPTKRDNNCRIGTFGVASIAVASKSAFKCDLIPQNTISSTKIASFSMSAIITISKAHMDLLRL